MLDALLRKPSIPPPPLLHNGVALHITNHPSSVSAEDLLAQWGWETAPDEVREAAELTARLRHQGIDAILVDLGLVTREDADAALAERAAGLSVFDAIAQRDDSLYAHRQRVLAIQAGLQYFADFSNPQVALHERFSEKELLAECESLGAVLMRVQNRTDLLVFADREVAYRRWVQMSGAELATSKLKHAGLNPVCAIGRRDAIMALVRDHSQLTVETVGAISVIYESRLRETATLSRLADLHELTIAAGGTDIHIDPDGLGNVELMMRVHGRRAPIDATLTIEQYHEIKGYLLKQSRAQLRFERIEAPLDGSYQYSGRSGRANNVRASFIPLGHGSGGDDELVSISLRLLPNERGEIDLASKQVFPQVIKDIDLAVQPSQGLILLAGPTGSGKSTTIAGTIRQLRLAHGSTKKILSLEDPIERPVPGVVQIQIPYKYRKSGDGFATFVRNFLRHDPDVCWLGEIRDSETATNAITLATTGHLVLSTVHSETPIKAVSRLTTMLPVDMPELKEAMIEALTLVIGQRLVPRVCKECSTVTPPTAKEVEFFDYLQRQRGLSLALPAQVPHAHEAGCPACRAGFTGVLPINEVLVMDAVAKEVFLRGRREEIRALSERLSVRFEESALALIDKGVTTLDGLKF